MGSTILKISFENDLIVGVIIIVMTLTLVLQPRLVASAWQVKLIERKPKFLQDSNIFSQGWEKGITLKNSM